MAKTPKVINELITEPKKNNVSKKLKTVDPKKITSYTVNTESEAFKYIDHLVNTREPVSTEGMTREEFFKRFF
jgi:hypothetical protein